MSASLSSRLPIFFFLFSCLSVGQTALTVAAASDLAPLQNQLATACRKNEPNWTVRFVNGASALLAQQIENGAPYDVFLSANAGFVDRLASNRKLLPESVRPYAIGRVAILWRDEKRHPLSELAQSWVRFVALPNPKLAPYGVAAQESLEHAGVWEFVRQKVVYGENVRQALQLFESGNADAVLTAAALVQGKNPELIPAAWHQPIVQKAGIVASTPNRGAAEKFLDFLLSPPAQAIFTRFGFSNTPRSEPKRR